MLVEKELKKLFQQLVQEDVVHLTLNGFDVVIKVFDGCSKLSLSTPVYFGGNYIPKSVRKCVSERPPFPHQKVNAFLTIDEDNFQIHLNYLGRMDTLHTGGLKFLLEDFSELAENWRLFLDEHDKNDLVHIRSIK